MKITFKQRIMDIGMVILCVSTILSACVVIFGDEFGKVNGLARVFFLIPASIMYFGMPLLYLRYLYENWNVPKL